MLLFILLIVYAGFVCFVARWFRLASRPERLLEEQQERELVQSVTSHRQA